MLTHIGSLLVFVAFFSIVWPAGITASAKTLVDEFHKNLRDKAAFAEADFNALARGQSVVKLLPVQDKREVAVCGLVNMQTQPDEFLQSFRETLTSKNNAAVIDTGTFSATPNIDDLQNLNFENRDIEDLKDCVVGDCKLKLSAAMIDRLHREVDFNAPGFRLQAVRLLKEILLDYVRDYQARGDVALIEYNDKPDTVRLSAEQRDLMTAASSINGVLSELPLGTKGSPNPAQSNVESMIVWQKIKFGLKPVFAINHIMIYRLDQKTGPQIVILTKQIYASHYFNSSLATTVFGNLTGASGDSYLFYQNRSRADGFDGLFGKVKHEIVEGKAIEGLKGILARSKSSLDGRKFNDTTAAATLQFQEQSWKKWLGRGLYASALLFLIAAFAGLLVMGKSGWKGSFSWGVDR